MNSNTPETEYQLQLLEEMIQRRIANTGDTREEACQHIENYLMRSYNERLDDELNYDTSGK